MPTHDIIRRGIAQVPEGRRIFPRMTVYENLQLGASLSEPQHFAADLERAIRFQDIWERLTKCPVLTLKPVGLSRFADKGGRTVLREEVRR